MVTGAFIVLSISAGLAFYGLAVYLNAFSHEFGWDVSSVSLATTVFFIVSGLFGVVVARLISVHDPRRVIVTGGVVGGIALASLSQVSEKWHLYVIYSIFAMAVTSSGIIPVTTVVTRWFHRRRGVALAVASTGLSAGGAAVTPIAKWLLDTHGISTGAPILGVVFILGTVPFTLWLIKPDPARLGWLPDGEPAARSITPQIAPGVPYNEAVRTRFFIAASLGYVFVFIAQVGGIQQLVKMTEERTNPSTAGLATLALAIAAVVARLIGGKLIQIVPMTAFASGMAAFQGMTLIGLAFAEQRLALFIAIVGFGATVGNMGILQPLLVVERFGARDYARLYSRIQLVSTIGLASGPFLLGVLHDHAGGYRTSYAIAGISSAIGAMVIASGGSANPDSSRARGSVGRADQR